MFIPGIISSARLPQHSVIGTAGDPDVPSRAVHYFGDITRSVSEHRPEAIVRNETSLYFVKPPQAFTSTENYSVANSISIVPSRSHTFLYGDSLYLCRVALQVDPQHA